MSEPVAKHDQQTERTNKVVSAVVGSVLALIVGVIAVQNVDRVKLVDRNKLWADTWKQQLSKPRDLPEFKPAVDWSDPKFDPSKLSVSSQSLSIDLSSQQQGSAAGSGSHRRR